MPAIFRYTIDDSARGHDLQAALEAAARRAQKPPEVIAQWILEVMLERSTMSSLTTLRAQLGLLRWPPLLIQAIQDAQRHRPRSVIPPHLRVIAGGAEKPENAQADQAPH